MNKLSIIAITAIVFIAQPGFTMTGREIMEKSNALPEPKTVKSAADMTIHKGSMVMKRQILLTGMKFGENDKVLVKIRELPSGNITRVLTHTKKGAEDLQWLKLANGRIKRIASGDRSGAFANSHLFYEDLQSRDINDYTYTLLGEEKVEGLECYKIKAIPKPGKSVYDRADFFVIKSGEFMYFVARIDIYYKDYLYKRLVNYEIKNTSGIITPYRAVMYRLNKKGKNLGRTTVEIRKIMYNSSGISDSIFNRNSL